MALAEFSCTVTPDAVQVDEQRRFEAWRRRNPGARFVMTFEDEEEAKNNGQLRYFHVLVEAFSTWSGYENSNDHDEATIELLKKFGTIDPRTHQLRRLSAMSRKEIAALTQRVERWLIQQEIPIPEPSKKGAA